MTTIHGDGDVYPPDLLGRDFTAELPGTRLVGDIAYLRTSEGWAYLAVVIDLATRMVVGWQIAEHMRISLVIDALEMTRDHGLSTAAAAAAMVLSAVSCPSVNTIVAVPS